MSSLQIPILPRQEKPHLNEALNRVTIKRIKKPKAKNMAKIRKPRSYAPKRVFLENPNRIRRSREMQDPRQLYRGENTMTQEEITKANDGLRPTHQPLACLQLFFILVINHAEERASQWLTRYLLSPANENRIHFLSCDYAHR